MTLFEVGEFARALQIDGARLGSLPQQSRNRGIQSLRNPSIGQARRPQVRCNRMMPHIVENPMSVCVALRSSVRPSLRCCAASLH